jgi:predicted metalloendopeptidase
MLMILKDLIIKEPKILNKYYQSGIQERNIDELFNFIPKLYNANIYDSINLLNSYNLSSPININVCVNTKFSDKYTVCISQGGLGLPYRYYNIEEIDILVKYYFLVEKILSIILKKEININKLFEIEVKIAKISLSPEEQMDIENTYNPISLSELKQRFSKINWDKLLKQLNIHDELIVESFEYLYQLQEILIEYENDMELYFIWNLIRSSSSHLTHDIIDIFFNFYGLTLQGKQKRKTVEKEVIQSIENLLDDFLCMEFKKLEMMNSSDIKYVTNLCYQVKEKYKDVLNSFKWLSDETRKKALIKLDKLGIKVGYPEVYDDYSDFVLPTSNNYLSYFFYIQKYSFDKYIKKYNNKEPVNKKLWYMNSFEVNAAFIPSNNEIIIPAAILLEPFYSSNNSDTQNYSGVGFFIGHEVMHAFDTHGRHFDENGNYNNWWTKEDLEKYEEISQKIINQYNKYKLNGILTLGENFADIYGFKIALELYSKIGKNRDGFYKHYAFCNRELITSEALKLQIASDEHAPSQWRVNGVLSNIKEFYLDYNIKEGDKMWLEENERFI